MYVVDRKASGTIVVPRLAVSIVGGIQPNKMRDTAQKLTLDGLLQRFWPIWIQDAGKPKDEPPDSALDAALARLVQSLADGATDTKYKFDAEADVELKHIEDFKEREIARCEEADAFRDFINKMPGAFARTALVFHFIDWYSDEVSDLVGDPPIIIPAETARRTRSFLTDFVLKHAAAFYRKIVRTGRADTDAQWIGGYILSRGLAQISDREIDRACPSLRRLERRPQRLAAMHELEAEGWVHVCKLGRDHRPAGWSVNPCVHDGRFAATAERERTRRIAVREAIAAVAETA